MLPRRFVRGGAAWNVTGADSEGESAGTLASWADTLKGNTIAIAAVMTKRESTRLICFDS